MPHVIVEYSSNVADRTDVQSLLQQIHKRVLATGVAALGGLRTRAFAATEFVVADGAPDHGYLAAYARLAAGRSDAERAAVLAAISEAISEHLGDAAEGLAISVEYQEIDLRSRVNDNRIRLAGSGSP